ncbi:IS66 family insertion sequence element accessory protein TnpB [Cobetia crustatorum]|uniref:IS66 family insertion sequence element accessory protein TnpB n=1 Tax=Cobetia crustatorum TaxID=553385 RepID=UPI0004685B7F|nr:IS66 family insertion sequence element accessory protein TnpB [Cobetia crustatorum]
MIRIDEIWLDIEPLDMRAGPDTALALVVKVVGAARPHCAYLFANRCGNRMKVLLHDGLGIWLCTRRLNQGKFYWAGNRHGDCVELFSEKVMALVQGLSWQHLSTDSVISVV